MTRGHAGSYGPLLSAAFAERELETRFAGRLGEGDRAAAFASFQRWWRRVDLALGPASGVRTVTDVAVVPLLGLLRLRPERIRLDARHALLAMHARSDVPLVGAVAPWGEPPSTAWLPLVAAASGAGARWALWSNGTRLRVADVERAWARRYVEFDLRRCANDRQAFAVLWALTRAAAFAPSRDAASSASSMHATPAGRSTTAGSATPTEPSCLLDDVVDASTRYSANLRGALRAGVRCALARLVPSIEQAVTARMATPDRRREHRAPPPPVADQALTVVFRILFLLYAEARALVPLWHPTYRDSYTIASVREDLERGGRAGCWDALCAISRLAHTGCRVADLEVVPFNGQLFAPANVPAATRRAVSDAVAGDVLLALSTYAPRRGARVPFTFRDLGVEQLGAVYEHLLDDLPARGASGETGGTYAGDRSAPDADRAPQQSSAPHSIAPDRPVGERAATRRAPTRSDSVRKETSSFYTPAPLTHYLVRRTLAPLVEGRSAAGVLSLTVLDPAMGSGAFLVAACRYLASAYESALVRDGACRAGDITRADRAVFRRVVAQRCLFGVDRNPMAVQLARLSLWLLTLAADAPLTFLDHRLEVGDSLVGASLEDLARQPGRRGGSARAARARDLPLFPASALEAGLGRMVADRWRLALTPDTTADVVREKARTLDRLERSDTRARVRALLDLWCAGWFWEGRVPSAATFDLLGQALAGGSTPLAAALRDSLLQQVGRIAARGRFLHWRLQFPEVFIDADGRPLARPGFDAVLCNPPWDMVRADAGAALQRAQHRVDAAALVGFVRDAGVYRVPLDAHANLYQLFAARTMTLVKRGGRLGLVLPGGLMTDHGAAHLRRQLLEQLEVDALVSLDNSRGFFPIHRSTRVLLATATAGRPTTAIRCRFEERDPAVLDGLPDQGGDERTFPVMLTPEFLRRVSGDRLAAPRVRRQRDVELLDRLFSRLPALSSPEGWNARFSRELNAADDRPHFTDAASDVPVVEGKHLRPFVVDVPRATWRVPASTLQQLLGARSAWERPRLAYRDIASSTNRLTLIAAILPARVVSTHTVFCLRSPFDLTDQLALCALLNSYVANFVVRCWVTTHVTVALVERLPIPRGGPDGRARRVLANLARRLMAAPDPEGDPAYADMQGIAARLYGLTADEFGGVLETFPLVPERIRRAALHAFARDRRGRSRGDAA